ncbi:MAG: response regulator [Acidobacteria bacterium]|nr:response regulator [Acidobacteriota bacterium]
MSQRILVIDFEPRSLKATVAWLTSAGYSVHTASNGREVAEAVNQPEADLIVMEPMIPGHDGFKLCAALKQGGRNGHKPSIIIASRIYRGPRFRGMAKDAGADSFLERPQQDQLLLELIQRLMPPSPVAESAAAATRTPEYIELSDVPAVGTIEEPGPDRWAAPAAPPPEAAPIRRAASEAPPPAPPAPPPARPATPVPDPAHAPLPFFSSLSDGDIEDALSRALGETDPAPHIVPLPPLAAAPGPPLDPFANAAGEDVDRLLANLEPEDNETNLIGVPSGPWPIATPPAFEPVAPPPVTEAPRAALPAADENGFSLDDGVTHGFVPRRPSTPREERDTGYELSAAVEPVEPVEQVPAVEPVEPLPPVEPVAAAAPAPLPADEAGADLSPAPLPEADSPWEPPAPAPIPAPEEKSAALDRELDGLFHWPEPSPEAAALVAETPEPAVPAPPDAVEPEPEVAEAAVPEGLRGMDVGTAELLSSLEELEDSLPRQQAVDETAWTGATMGETGVELADPGLPYPAPAPAPGEDEPSLDDVFRKMQAAEPADSPAPSAPGAPVQPQEPAAPEYELAVSGVSDRQPPVPKKKRSRWSGWFLALVAGALVVAGAAQGLNLFESATPVTTQAAAPPVAPVRVAASATVAEPVAAVRTADRRTDLAPPIRQLPRATPAREAPVHRAPLDDAPRVAAARPREAAPSPAAVIAAAPAQRQSRVEPVTDTAPLPERPAPAEAAAVLPDDGSRPGPAMALGVQPASEPSGGSAPAPEEPSDEALAAGGVSPVVRLGELDRPLATVHAPRPAVTPEALDAGVKGRVFLNVLVGPDGSVREARVIIEPGYGLGKVAKEAVMGWRYTPPLRQGEPVRVWKTEIVEFGS